MGSSMCTTVTVLEAVPVADIQITSIDIVGGPYYDGDSVTFEVTYHNYGNASGTVSVDLTVDEVSAGTDSVTLDPDQEDTRQYITDPLSAGDHQICAQAE